MSKLVGGISSFVVTLMMYGLSRSSMYSEVNSSTLVMVLLLFAFTTVGVLIAIGLEKLDSPKKLKKKEKNKNAEMPPIRTGPY